MLRQIFYISRSLAQPCELEWILVGARHANERRGITGMLFHTGDHFAQLFEGTPADVDATMADITSDKRHDQIRVLFDIDAVARMCKGWRMGFLSARGADALLRDLHVSAALSRERIDNLLALLKRELLSTDARAWTPDQSDSIRPRNS